MKKMHLIVLSFLVIGVSYLLLRQKKAVSAEVPPLPPEPPLPPLTVPITDFIKAVARYYNPSISDNIASQIASSVDKWVKKRNLNLFSVLAIIAQESSFRPVVTGSAGERGLMQVASIVLEELKRVFDIVFNRDRLFEIDYNIEAGTLFYLHCVRLAEGNRFEAIARYHRTTKWWEAKDYANDVLAKREKIENMYEELTV